MTVAMSQADFIKALTDDLAAEQKDAGKYADLALHAPTIEMRKTLLCIAKEELMHQAKIQGMIYDLNGGGAV